MEAEPRWFALIAALVVAAIAFPLVTGDLWRALPPGILALAMALLLVRGRRAPEAVAENRYRDRRAVAIFMGLAIVTAVAAIVVAVLQAL
jgi:uncharacterized membrane protein